MLLSGVSVGRRATNFINGQLPFKAPGYSSHEQSPSKSPKFPKRVTLAVSKNVMQNGFRFNQEHEGDLFDTSVSQIKRPFKEVTSPVVQNRSRSINRGSKMVPLPYRTSKVVVRKTKIFPNTVLAYGSGEAMPNRSPPLTSEVHRHSIPDDNRDFKTNL